MITEIVETDDKLLKGQLMFQHDDLPPTNAAQFQFMNEHFPAPFVVEVYYSGQLDIQI